MLAESVPSGGSEGETVLRLLPQLRVALRVTLEFLDLYVTLVSASVFTCCFYFCMSFALLTKDISHCI